MEDLYGQDCGSYSIRFEPAYTFLTTQNTGFTSPNTGLQYPDQITAFSNDSNDIGQYTVDMVIYQDGVNT